MPEADPVEQMEAALRAMRGQGLGLVVDVVEKGIAVQRWRDVKEVSESLFETMKSMGRLDLADAFKERVDKWATTQSGGNSEPSDASTETNSAGTPR